VVPGFWFLVRKRFSDIQPILFFIFGLGFLYSLMFGNVGLVIRQRAQLLPWLLIFAAVGLEMRMLKQLEKRRAKDRAYAGEIAAFESPLTNFNQPLVSELPQKKP
jgi:hypothetical protein